MPLSPMQAFLAARQQASQQQAQELGMLGQLAQLQGTMAEQKMIPLKMEQARLSMETMRNKAIQEQEQRARLGALAQTLSPEDRLRFEAAPMEFLKELNKRYTVGDSLVTGSGSPVYQAQPKPTLTEVGVAGQPGVTQRAWALPGQSDVTPVGAPKMPDILNPAVQAARQKVAQAGATKVNVPINVSTEKKYGEQFAGKMADQDASMLDAARKAPELATRANRVKSLLQGNVITGFGADFRLQLGKAAQLAGLKFSDDAITNTEVLATELAKNTLDAIKASGLGSGTGFSNADRDFLEKAVGGKVNLEKPTIDRLASLAHRAATKSAEQWSRRVKQIPKSALEGTGVPQESVTVPPLGESAPSGWSIRPLP